MREEKTSQENGKAKQQKTESKTEVSKVWQLLFMVFALKGVLKKK